MDNKIEQFKKYNKDRAKMNSQNATKAVRVLSEIYLENNNVKEVCDIIVESFYPISKEFVEKIYFKFEEDQKIEFWRTLINNFNKAKIDLSRYCLYLSIIAEVVNYKLSDNNYFNLLYTVIYKAESGGSFLKTTIKAFEDHLLIKTSGKILEVDFSILDEFKLKALKRCFDSLNLQNTQFNKLYSQWLQKYNFKGVVDITIENEITNIEVTEKESVIDAQITLDKKEIVKSLVNESNQSDSLKTITSINDELNKLLKNILGDNSMFDALLNDLNDKNNEIITLKNSIAHELKKNVENDRIIDDLKQELIKKDEKISVMAEDFVLFNKADDINKKQELEALKKSIELGVKIQYEDFVENKDVEFNEDNYIAFKNSLGQIFKALKRNGIDL